MNGITATGIAVLISIAWLGIGSVFLGNKERGDLTAPALSLLIGSGLTSFALALFAWAGLIRPGVYAVAAVAALALLIRRKSAIELVSMVIAPWKGAVSSMTARISVGVIVLVAWMSAVSPPRSADAMRYHLAHVKQILAEGQWTMIPDYHYALPFGWSLSYLPFEMIGLPQGAQLIGLCLFVVMLGTMMSWMHAKGLRGTVVLIPLLLMLHPATTRVFSEAGADAYALIVVMVVAMMLADAPKLSARQMMLLGFASWVGIQSRYQLVAVGIASAIVLLIVTRREMRLLTMAGTWVVGAVAAGLLASPFYIRNFLAFGNPVWPLMISKSAAISSYTDAVARQFTQSLTGTFAPVAIAKSLGTLLTTAFLFPLSIIVLTLIVVALVSRGGEGKRLGMFGGIFFLLWFLMAPFLYPRFILMFVPVAVLVACLVVEKSLERFAVPSVVVLALVAVGVFRDNIRYVVTGDEREYHRFTWAYPVYQWVNRSTAADARVLVIISSQHTYYLDRFYRRADPWLSGVVDWSAVKTGAELNDFLDREKYDYVIFEDRDWHWFTGGRSMELTMRDAVKKGLLVPERRFDERLYRSRTRRSFTSATIYLLRNQLGEWGPGVPLKTGKIAFPGSSPLL